MLVGGDSPSRPSSTRIGPAVKFAGACRRGAAHHLLVAERMRSILLVAALGSILLGCTDGIEAGGNGNAPTGGEPDASTPTTATDFDRAMMAIGGEYRSFTKINKRAYTSSLGAFDINVFVHGDVMPYRSIHPDENGSGVKISVGTVIVREVYGADGKVAKLTLMAKGPTGYDPTIGDWWFGEADPQANPMKMGRLTECHGCHVPRAGDDYLFGVPRSGGRED